jgi:hypothetical protein
MVDLDSALVDQLDRIAPADPVPRSRWGELRPHRMRLSARAAGVAVAVAALAAVVALAVPWHRGPAALSAAEAARVVRRTAAALAPHGGVLHIRLHVTVASPYHPRAVAWSGDEDRWIDERNPQSYRLRTTFPNLPSPIESGGDYLGQSPTYVYDAANDKLYHLQRYSYAAFVDPIAQVKRDLRRAGGGITVKRVGGTYRLEDDRNLRRPTVLIVDATTYRPIREIATIGGGATFALFPQKPTAPLSEEWQIVSEYRVYEYLSDGKLASIRAKHPNAKIAPGRDMPRAFKRRFQPWTG